METVTKDTHVGVQPLQDTGPPTAGHSRVTPSIAGAAVVVGTLVGFRSDAQVPLVPFPGQPGSAALAARVTIDLHAAHIGGQVVLLFEEGDARRPLIVGLLRTARNWPLPDQPGQVDVEADGQRLVVRADEQLVLRCGKASITLTKAGKILVEGTYVSHRSSGVMRIKGGSVQIN